MKQLFWTLAALAAFGFPVTAQDDHPHITGEVFIVTGAGENVKLGRVEISALKTDEVAEAIKAVDDKFAPLIPKLAEWRKLAKKQFDSLDPVGQALKSGGDVHAAIEAQESKGAPDERQTKQIIDDEVHSKSALNYAAGALKYFRVLPAPICTTKTDSDGKYDLQLPSKDAVVLTARADRPAIGEVFYWLVYFDPSKGTTYTFSSDNETDSGARESVVSTVAGRLSEAEGEADIDKELKRADEVMPPPLLPKPTPALTVAEWKEKAIEQYPQLAISGSPLNLAFVAKFKAYQGTRYFVSPDWPMRLAKECAEAVEGK